jgi:hypothetical protein
VLKILSSRFTSPHAARVGSTKAPGVYRVEAASPDSPRLWHRTPRRQVGLTERPAAELSSPREELGEDLDCLLPWSTREQSSAGSDCLGACTRGVRKPARQSVDGRATSAISRWPIQTGRSSSVMTGSRTVDVIHCSPSGPKLRSPAAAPGHMADLVVHMTTRHRVDDSILSVSTISPHPSVRF